MWCLSEEVQCKHSLRVEFELLQVKLVNAVQNTDHLSCESEGESDPMISFTCVKECQSITSVTVSDSICSAITMHRLEATQTCLTERYGARSTQANRHQKMRDACCAFSLVILGPKNMSTCFNLRAILSRLQEEHQ